MGMRPLTILVHPLLGKTSEIEELRRRGHTVELMDGERTVTLTSYDLILGPNCVRMVDTLLPLLAVTVKGARVVKYGVVLKPKKGEA